MFFFIAEYSQLQNERRLWSMVSLASITMLIALFGTGLSTALDRGTLLHSIATSMAHAPMPLVLSNTFGILPYTVSGSQLIG